MPTGYYTHHLAAQRLRQCYDLAPPEVKAYLEAEIDFVISKVSPDSSVLELGCGYGRVLERLLPHARLVCGIDTSPASLLLARETIGRHCNCQLAAMNALFLGFPDQSFDVVICIQNGISAFGVDQLTLMGEAVRVTRPYGKILFSSYAGCFWPHRLAWFEIQAAHGLIGEIDYQATKEGVIVCKDGFQATTVDPESFRRLATAIGLEPNIIEVGKSSLFCELVNRRKELPK